MKTEIDGIKRENKFNDGAINVHFPLKLAYINILDDAMQKACHKLNN